MTTENTKPKPEASTPEENPTPRFPGFREMKLGEMGADPKNSGGVEFCLDNRGRDRVVGRINPTIDALVDAGCKLMRAQDCDGVIRRGWWQDGVFLADSDSDALRALRGQS